jgi:choline kinase
MSNEGLIRTGNRNVFFNAAVQQAADEGLKVAYTETHGLPWTEIDDPGDLEFARTHDFPKLNPESAAA